MIAGLVALIVAGVAVVLVAALVLAAVGLVIGGMVALVVLAAKAAPLILLGWLAVKLLGGGQHRCGRRPLPRSPGRFSNADEAWLDSRA